MDNFVKEIRKSAKRYRENHEEKMTEIAKKASNEQIRELQRIGMAIQDVVLFRLGLE